MPDALPEIHQLIRSNRKTIALIIQRDGSLIIRAPLKASKKQILEVVAEKAGWIRAKQAEMKERQPATLGKEFLPGERLPYLGKNYPLQLTTRQRPPLELADGAFWLSHTAQPSALRLFTAWYRARAAEHFSRRVAELAQAHGFHYTRLRLSSARTRWGSCSSLGTVSLNWRLIMAPPDVIDYVIYHELAHLREHNHGPRFWALVAALMPNYKTHLDWLKKHGASLSLESAA